MKSISLQSTYRKGKLLKKTHPYKKTRAKSHRSAVQGDRNCDIDQEKVHSW